MSEDETFRIFRRDGLGAAGQQIGEPLNTLPEAELKKAELEGNLTKEERSSGVHYRIRKPMRHESPRTIGKKKEPSFPKERQRGW
jgi:hypothetical protein